MAELSSEEISFTFPKNVDGYAGWHSMQIQFMLDAYVGGDKQMYVNEYLSSLRPEIAAEMVRVADELFTPEVAHFVKQYQEEWDGSQ